MKKMMIKATIVFAMVVGGVAYANAKVMPPVSDCPNGCLANGNGCYCNGWYECYLEAA